MVPLLAYVIKLTKWPTLALPTVSRTARRDRQARSPGSYRARLRRRVRQRCVNELSDQETSPAERARDEGVLTNARCCASGELLTLSDRTPAGGVQK